MVEMSDGILFNTFSYIFHLFQYAKQLMHLHASEYRVAFAIGMCDVEVAFSIENEYIGNIYTIYFFFL